MFEDPVCTNLSICSIDLSLSLFWLWTDCAMIPFCWALQLAQKCDFKTVVVVSIVL